MPDGVATTIPPTELCDALRTAILNGEYAFGYRLKIDEIARRFGVSHMPVRRALVQLEGERLVTTSPNKGASVRAVDVESIEQSYDILILLEGLLARRASERMIPEVLGRLSRVEDDLELALSREDHKGVLEENIRFHAIISAHAGNREAAELVDRNQILMRAFRVAFGFDASRLPGVVADHHSLIRAFGSHDADGAAAIASGHAAKARNDLIATIRAASTNHDDSKPNTGRKDPRPGDVVRSKSRPAASSG